MKSASEEYPIGRFYIIAPENAVSVQINLNDFDEVWQYGSNENHGGDPVWLQDGVAPQISVNGIMSLDVAKGGRAYIPNTELKGFVDSHRIAHYGWIFRTLNIGDKGYVKKRK